MLLLLTFDIGRFGSGAQNPHEDFGFGRELQSPTEISEQRESRQIEGPDLSALGDSVADEAVWRELLSPRLFP